MTTKIRHLYPSQDFPAIAISPDEAVPLRHLEALVQEARRRVLAGAVSDEDQARVMREADSLRYYGAAQGRIVYDDELTPSEVLTDRLAELDATLAKLRALLPQPGGAMAAEDVAALRALLAG